MKPQQRLEQRASQTLVMTPRLQQAVRVLQVSAAELQSLLSQQLLENPFLEGQGLQGQDLAELVPASEVYGKPPGPSARSKDFDKDAWLSQVATTKITLRDHVAAQIEVDITNPQEHRLAYLLLDYLEDTGYLSPDHDKMIAGLEIDQNLFEATLRKLQAMDPAGVFARSLQECLINQVDALEGGEKIQLRALVGHLEAIANHKIDVLCQRLGLTASDLQKHIKALRQLDPKPGLRFEAEPVSPRVPDVVVAQEANGKWRVTLNDEALPQVFLSQDCDQYLKQREKHKGDRAYLTERFAQANWVIKTLNHRYETILRVTEAILDHQENFFNYGLSYLKPLTLHEIATELQVHESTVSRATSQKYLRCPRGVFELKFFFSAAIAGDHNVDHASQAVRAQLCALVKSEPAGKPYSDEKLVLLLSEKGIQLARRTVAKYRDMENIPSSAQRKRQKMWHG